MAEVERFEEENVGQVGPLSDGEWVRYSDYEKARKQGAEEERERLREDETLIAFAAARYEDDYRCGYVDGPWCLAGRDVQLQRVATERRVFSAALAPVPSEPEEGGK